MPTNTIMLTSEPVQISNGNETGYISAINGEFCWVDSDSKPTDLTSPHSELKVSFNPPFVIWAWSPASGRAVTVSKREA